jgi:tetratricopeptide (TPR) repeat protein
MNKHCGDSLLPLCILVLATAVLSSCAGFGDMMLGMKGDPELIDRGVAAWNENEGVPDSAYKFWTHIKAKDTRAQYLAYIDNYKTGIKALEAASALKTDNYDSLLSSYGEINKTNFPQNLKVGKFTVRVKTLRERAEEAAETKVRGLIKEGKLALARETVTAALEIIDPSDRLSGILKEIDAKYAFKKEQEAKARQVETDADTALDTAHNATDQDKKIEAYKLAIAGYENAEALLNDLGQKEPSFAGSSDADRKRLRKKGQDAGIEMERKIKDYAYALKEKQLEDFARVPDQKDLGALTGDQIVAYNAQTKKKIQGELNTVKDLAVTAPNAVPAADIKAMEDNVKRIDKVQVEVKKPAEKGKTIMPVMIGLFNPQKQDKEKSRPGIFRSNTAAKSDQWWGMADIPKSTMNDLVVSLNDDRACKIMGQSGSKSQDLVSKDKKFGNNYPVLNAGPQFQDGLYYLDLSKGKTGAYQGEVVIYKAFITRMR